MDIQEKLGQKAGEFVKTAYGIDIENIDFQPTNREFEGDTTIVVFPLLKYIKTNPVKLGQEIGNYLTQEIAEVAGFNVVRGFLNLVLSDGYFLDAFAETARNPTYGNIPVSADSKTIMVEYSSPNTNKPLHLGHVRNILLGYSVAEILKATGHKVYKTQIVNDRGIHICKSMVAWLKFAEKDKNGVRETPASTGIKGDRFVGDFYVKFDKAYKKEITELVDGGMPEKEAKKTAPIMKEAQKTLKKWEAGDEQTIALWKTMNGWVYKGFDVTYKNIGVDFDKIYYESDTYLLGKDIIIKGLKDGVFFKKQDGSVWIDLKDEGLDEKLVMRADGTAVYMTQDIGTAIQRVKDYAIDGMVYTVGNEQDYHFKVLFLILKKLGYTWANNLYHLSYGMVELPSGKMKSREGTVVDADDLMGEMTRTAGAITEKLGKLDGFDTEEKHELYKIIGLAALKYYILKVDPKKEFFSTPKNPLIFRVIPGHSSNIRMPASNPSSGRRSLIIQKKSRIMN